MRAPAFWWRPPGLLAALFAPFGAIYGAVAVARLRRRGKRAGVPVICVGNPTLGGAGKTPAAIALARLLAAAGARPFLVTRGYRGRERGPLLVDPAQHDAAAVGDEALLLARAAPTIVAADRFAGVELAARRGASVVVLDDGFQNPSVEKDFSLLVIDGESGVGNGRVFPAGPLRAPLIAQIERAQALVCNGKGAAVETVAALAARKGVPVFAARVVPEPRAAQNLAGQKVLAFAGIGRPEKFFRTLSEIGAKVAKRRAFPDHHPYSPREAEDLLATAKRESLLPVTTEKDRIRIAGLKLTELYAASTALPVTLEFDEEAALMRLVTGALARRRA
ncbi:MAG TPA: tetraacyldisaccharide 4'-kinase [Xanthobacteraceae bacterium]|nr:tetraacyldisaccharide 4'-kinase [Xanthobacteraceae bacterium]